MADLPEPDYDEREPSEDAPAAANTLTSSAASVTSTADLAVRLENTF